MLMCESKHVHVHVSYGFVKPSNNNHLPQNAKICFFHKSQILAKPRKIINTDENTLPTPVL